MERETENKKIVDAIQFFTHGKFRERKQYLAELRTPQGTSYNGYVFQKELYCWVVWKPTDIDACPQFKGEPLYKAIPCNVPVKNIPKILDAQPWTYV